MATPAPFNVTLHTPSTPLITCQPWNIQWDYEGALPPGLEPEQIYLKFTLNSREGRHPEITLPNGYQIGGILLDLRVPLPNRSYNWSEVGLPAGNWFVSTRTYDNEVGVGVNVYTKTEWFEVQEGEDTSCIGQAGPSGDIPLSSAPSTGTPSSDGTASPTDSSSIPTQSESSTPITAHAPPTDDDQTSSTTSNHGSTELSNLNEQTLETEPTVSRPTESEPASETSSQEGDAIGTQVGVKLAMLGGAAMALLRFVM